MYDELIQKIENSNQNQNIEDVNELKTFSQENTNSEQN
jgi:hypothetical protein